MIVPNDATSSSAIAPFDLGTSLRRTAFLFNGDITQSEAIEADREDEPVYRGKKIEEADEPATFGQRC